MSHKSQRRQLYISDTQKPFIHPQALEFILKVKKEFKIEDDEVYHVGDDLDFNCLSSFKKNPNSEFTPLGEIEQAKKQLKLWYKYLPKMKLAYSNHVDRISRKAMDAEIPASIIKSYREIIGAPIGWQWRDAWIFNAGREMVCVQHGTEYRSARSAINAAIDNGMMNTVTGHIHTNFSINHIRTRNKKCWAMSVGCLVDESATAFDYAKHHRNKPLMGCGVTINGGGIPLLIPLEGFL